MTYLLLAAALLVSAPAFAQTWNANNNCTGSLTSIKERAGYYCFTDATDSDVIDVGPGAFSLELNPDINGVTTGALVTLYRCAGASKANDCRPFYIDLDGDGIIDAEPFDGVTAGKVGFDSPFFGGRFIYISVSVGPTATTARVKIEAGL